MVTYVTEEELRLNAADSFNAQRRQYGSTSSWLLRAGSNTLFALVSWLIVQNREIIVTQSPVSFPWSDETTDYIILYLGGFAALVFLTNLLVEVFGYIKFRCFTPTDVQGMTVQQRRLLGLCKCKKSNCACNLGPVVMTPKRHQPSSLGRPANSSPSNSFRPSPSATMSRQMSNRGASQGSTFNSPLSVARSPLSPRYHQHQLRSPGGMGLSPNISRISTPMSPQSPKSGWISDRFSLQRHLDAWKEQDSTTPKPEEETSFTGSYSFRESPFSYQPAPRTMNAPKTLGNDFYKVLSPTEVWRMIGARPEHIQQSTYNCQRWLTNKILAPMVNEIDAINKRLKNFGMTERVGVDSLTAIQQLQLHQSMPIVNLDRILPYLRVHDNQPYVVSRIKELIDTGGYRWNSGGTMSGEFGKVVPWNPEFPTDAQLLVHCFLSYMNDPTTVYMPRAHDTISGGSRTFTYLHYLKDPETPASVLKRKEKTDIYLYQTSMKPPHFKILRYDDETEKFEIWEVDSGRSNLFHAIIVLLWYVRSPEFGHYGELDTFADNTLGPHGLGMLQILSWREKEEYM